MSASKFFFAYGLGNSFIYPAGVGGSVVLVPDRPLPDIIFSAIHQYKPTVFFGVPTLYANMLAIKRCGEEVRFVFVADLCSARRGLT